MFKRIMIITVVGLFSMTNAFAGKEDWNGSFTIKNSSTSSETVNHTPKNVSYLFITAGECIHLGKGSNLNGVVIKQDINLCTNSNVATFKAEVAKLGRILSESVKLGPTYSD